MLFRSLKLPEGEPIEHGMISRAVENAQKKVEGHNFEIRKHLIEYDDVMNKQREVIYTQRREVLGGEGVRETVESIVLEMVEDVVATFCPEKTPVAEWNWDSLALDMFDQFMIEAQLPEVDRNLTRKALEDTLKEQVLARLAEKEEEFTTPVMEHLMKVLLLQTIDQQWKDHLLSIDHLKEGIGLRGYAQRNPKEEYKREAYRLFMEMMGRIRQEVVQKLFRVQLRREEDVERMEEQQRKQRLILNRVGADDQPKQPATRDEERIGRNDPCPCGSGKKYKKCCGK